MVKLLKLGYKYVLVTAYALVISDLLTLAKDAAIDYVFTHRFRTVVDTLAEERREAERENVADVTNENVTDVTLSDSNSQQVEQNI